MLKEKKMFGEVLGPVFQNQSLKSILSTLFICPLLEILWKEATV